MGLQDLRGERFFRRRAFFKGGEGGIFGKNGFFFFLEFVLGSQINFSHFVWGTTRIGFFDCKKDFGKDWWGPIGGGPFKR